MQLAPNNISQSFLFEILTEELPPKSLLNLAETLQVALKQKLQKNDFSFGDMVFYATPRRLAILIDSLASKQLDKEIERKGPALDKAFDLNGNPTQACIGFAKSCHVDISELVTLENAQGKFIGCKQIIPGKTILETMPAFIEETLTALPIPKPMRWGSHLQKFIRPIHSVIMLYGKDIIHGEILGFKTGRKTRGHRFLHPNWIDIASPEHYEETLSNAFVIVNFEKRKANIKNATNELVKKELPLNSTAMLEDSLLNEVTSLTEWPESLCGKFDNVFLKVPQEALISSMRDHQRYFPIFDESKNLLPNFITVINIATPDKKRVIAGNERVLRARLSDAAFFYETDKKINLINRVDYLKNIIFQQKLGTLFDKTNRLQQLSVYLATHVNENVDDAKRVALLSKTDLTTALVGEFPELQGLAGYYYAIASGESKNIAVALNEQYMPRFSGDKLPETNLGAIIAIADRLDTLVGVFGINQQPSGDKDPFGLRRAALGIIRILIERKLSINLMDCINSLIDRYQDVLENKEAGVQVLTFIFERLRYWYQDQNISPDVFASVAALNIYNPYEFDQHVKAVQVFKSLPAANSLSSANKRVSNILEKYSEKISLKEIDETLFEHNEERELARVLSLQSENIKPLYHSANYIEVLKQLAALKEPVDKFFDKVLVMHDNKVIRENRLLLLKSLRRLFLLIADVALLQS